MKTDFINPASDMAAVEKVVKAAFSSTSDSSLDQWLSFPSMKSALEKKSGIGIKAFSEDGDIIGIIYAQQESPINGLEGEEKWVIIVTGVMPELAGKGIGTFLLQELEQAVKERGGKKLFVFTNKGDEQVINFYHKNKYEDAGWIKDYQYGENNSAVFLLKYI